VKSEGRQQMKQNKVLKKFKINQLKKEEKGIKRRERGNGERKYEMKEKEQEDGRKDGVW
jgi:hypothetical protein